MRLVLLGTGTSFGVPQIGCACRTCTSTDPRDRRTRTAALIEEDGKRLLIDTPPELRLQLVGARVDRLDAVLYTHAHADHVHGIDDLRALSVRQGAPLPAYGSPETLAELTAKFPYIFDPTRQAHPGTSRPELVPHPLDLQGPTPIAGMAVLALPLPHGAHTVLGYRVGPVAYLTDVKEIPEAARERLQDRMDVIYVIPDYYSRYPKPCMGGWASRQLTVTPNGDVLPCPAAQSLPLPRATVRADSLERIWSESPVMTAFRGTDWMPDPCRSCDRREVDFGGCRCQAYHLTGDAAATDPACSLAPAHGLIEAARAEALTPEAGVIYRAAHAADSA